VRVFGARKNFGRISQSFAGGACADRSRFAAGAFQKVTLERRHPLEHPNRKIEHVYFMEHGIASVVAGGDSGRQIEVGLIGCEGVSGLPVILGDDRSPHSTYMQVGGSGQKIPACRMFCEAMANSPSLRKPS
jgi:CRP-like cAMP-binding protein